MALAGAALRVRDRGVALELELAEEAGIEGALPPRRAERVDAQAGGDRRARHALARRRARAREIQARAVIDDTAG